MGGLVELGGDVVGDQIAVRELRELLPALSYACL
ncbi:hypothetical protein M2283_010142 [Streptomyces pseudovenezuelae]|uniref:Uncharacterized protein n=1 Tax=Streptomyces pseudovenezuelae TaxID=67350 RepID=A0ABT6M3U6_9ACTN|nr:hypothetical protein [Streptomyces pseudovenezuelae]